MRKHLTKIFAVMAMSVMTVGVVQATTVYTNESFSVTWSMADGASSTAVASPSNAVWEHSWSFGDSLVIDATATATYWGSTYTRFTRASTSGKLDNKRNKLDKSYVEYKFTPHAELTFTPTSLSFDITKVGTGDPNIWVECIQGATTTSIADNVTIRKASEGTPSEHLSYDLTSFPAIVATMSEFAIRIYIGKLDTDKQVAIANVVIGGTVSGTQYDDYTVTFSKGETGAEGVVPAAVYFSSVTIPVNRTLYKEGYTLTGWTDGINIYAIGEKFYPTSNTTLTPVFTANPYTLSQSLEVLTVRWDFQRQNGAPTVGWEGNSGLLVTQVNINGVSTDVKMDIDATSGKFNNAGWDDWCQINGGTVLSFPAISGAAVRAYSMSEPITGETKSTVDGAIYSAFASYVATYAASPTDGISSLTVQGGSYYRYLEVDFPASVVVLPLKTLVIDSIAVSSAILAAINNSTFSYTATLSGNIFTTEPVVKATFSDDATATAAVSGTGATRTYTFNQTVSVTPYTFVLNIEGINIYTPNEHAVNIDIKNNGGSTETVDGKKVWTSSTNSAYTMTTTNLDGYQADFKFDANTDDPYTIRIPENVVVKQFILKNFHANYSGGNGQLKTVTSAGATVTMPTKRTCVYDGYAQTNGRMHEGPAYDLVVNIENHVAGTPIVFTMVKSSQPMGWIQLVTEQEYTREHPHMNLNTLCFPYAIYEYSGAMFYTIQETEVNGSGELVKLVLEEHVGALSAGVPYFYDPTPGADKLVCYYTGDYTEVQAGDGGLTGLYLDNSPVPANKYVTVSNQLWKTGDGVTMGEYRAYVDPVVYSRPAQVGRKRMSIGRYGAPTAVEDVQSDNVQSTKIIRNGQLYIMYNGTMYNVQGQIVH